MNRFILAAASAACALCATVSCTEGFSTKTIGSSDKYALAEGGTDSLEIDIQIEYPASGLKQTAMENLSKALTASLFGDQYAAMPVEKAMEAYIKENVDEYRKATSVWTIRWVRLSGTTTCVFLGVLCLMRISCIQARET